MPRAIKVLIGILIVVVLVVAFFAGYNVRGRVASAPVEEGGIDVVEQVWDILFEDYVDKERLDDTLLYQGAVEGMLEALDDPYTSYLDAESYKLGLDTLQGEFEGIGAQIADKDDKITIIAPIAGSPAEKAGIRPGDVVLEINGESAADMSLAEAVLLIRGESGTAVELLVLHAGEGEPVLIEIVRDTIELSSVYFELIEDIAYINITHFAKRTDEELTTALEDTLDEEAEGIILDMRSNPGGLLDVVVDVASHFLEDGVVVSVVDNKGTNKPLTVKSKRVTVDLPMVVLVNSYSASGSEVLSGALQDYQRAVIAGIQTYGKGSVNVFRPLKDGSGLYVTTARWLTPNGYLIESEGIKPDYELELEGKELLQWAIDYLKAPKG